jgi:hypothetical protein
MELNQGRAANRNPSGQDPERAERDAPSGFAAVSKLRLGRRS